MTYARHELTYDVETLPRMPSWVTSGRPETSEDVAFLSGAALSHLHLVSSRADVPQTLLRNRLALRAAEACVTHAGRTERASDLRDAVAFLLPGDSPGPAGEVYLFWRRAVSGPCRSRRCIGPCRALRQSRSLLGWTSGGERRLRERRACWRRFTGIDRETTPRH